MSEPHTEVLCEDHEHACENHTREPERASTQAGDLVLFKAQLWSQV